MKTAKTIRRLAAALTLLALVPGAALAHATLVIGNLSVQPDPPVPGQSTGVTISLVDPLLVAVEDALVRIEFRQVPPEDPQVPASITGTEATEFLSLPVLFSTGYLSETEPGIYTGTFISPADGRYTVSVRDTTFRNEEAIANIGLNVGQNSGIDSGAANGSSRSLNVGSGAGSGVNGDVAFVLPPTPMAPASIGQWLLWIIGIPLAIGIIVTFLALRSKPEATEEAQETS